jgi:hypothetical protein
MVKKVWSDRDFFFWYQRIKAEELGEIHKKDDILLRSAISIQQPRVLV